MRLIVFAMALIVASFFPQRAAAQVDVIVFLDEASPLRPSFEVELAARGWHAVFVVPDAHPARRTVELGAVGSLWMEETEGRNVVRAFRTDRGTSARLAVAESASDPRMIAVVAAAMLEELLSHHESLEPPVPVPEVEARRPRVYPEPLGFYIGVELGGWLRLAEPPTGQVASRISLGLQWGDGFRLGFIGALDGHDDIGPDHERQTSPRPDLGVELGARFGDATWSWHFGAQALVGMSASHDGVSGVEVLAGGYVGLGLWAYRRVELGLRLSGDASIQPSWESGAVVRLALRAEFR